MDAGDAGVHYPDLYFARLLELAEADVPLAESMRQLIRFRHYDLRRTLNVVYTLKESFRGGGNGFDSRRCGQQEV